MSIITNDQRFDQFVAAAEGGSNYWYFLPDLSMCDKYKQPDQSLVDRVWAAVLGGERIPVSDREEPTNILGYFSLDGIHAGEKLMLENQPDHFADIISESGDAITGDVWFQYAVLGDIVYG